MFVVEAPFDMPAHARDLIGRPVSLNGQTFEVRGLVPRLPTRPIAAGEPIELLVAEALQSELGQLLAEDMDRV